MRIGVFDGFLSYKKTIVIMESTTEKRNISMLYWDEAKKGMMAGFIFSLFILLLFSFVSCDKDEDTSFEETPYYLGYFEGKVNRIHFMKKYFLNMRGIRELPRLATGDFPINLCSN